MKDDSRGSAAFDQEASERDNTTPNLTNGGTPTAGGATGSKPDLWQQTLQVRFWELVHNPAIRFRLRHIRTLEIACSHGRKIFLKLKIRNTILIKNLPTWRLQYAQ